MRILKKVAIITVIALVFGIVEVPQNEIIKPTVNIEAKTKKTKYKNGKLKTKKVTKYFSKKIAKKKKLANRIKSETYTKYNKKGKLIYKKVIKVKLDTPYVAFNAQRHIKIYDKFTKVKGKWKYTKFTEQMQNKRNKKTKWINHYKWISTFDKKTHKVTSLTQQFYNIENGKYVGKYVDNMYKNGTSTRRAYELVKGKIKLTSKVWFDKNDNEIKSKYY